MTMDPLSADRGKRLFWVQPNAMRDHYELHAVNQLYATLTFPHLLERNAVGETASGSFRFGRRGFLNPYVVIDEASTGATVATFRMRFCGGGNLEFADGRRLRWAAANFWETRWGFLADSRRMLLTIEKGTLKTRWSDILKEQAIVNIGDAVIAPCEMALLVSIGWYLMILQTQDAGAGAAASTAAIG